MNETLIYSVITLGGLGVLASGILFIVAKQFYVYEDPKIDEVEAALPAANCGGCGLPGCRPFAEALVKSDDISALNCPVGGSDVMAIIAELLGKEATVSEKNIAVLRCNGTYENARPKVNYQGAKSCLSAHSVFAGISGCPSGCLGLADCIDVCNFDALHMDKKTGLPVVDENKCVACNACVDICPRNLYELRPQGPDSKRVFVACMNTQKGAAAKKNCKVACIGCTKCAKVYDSGEKIQIKNSLSYIAPHIELDHGPAIVDCCPTNAILGINIPKFVKPVPTEKKEETEQSKTDS